MKESDYKNFKNFVELKLRELFDNFDRDFIKWDVESFARIIAQEIHGEYKITQKLDTANWLLVPEDAMNPCCHGCFNEFESCGTPCGTCQLAEQFDREWKIILRVPNKYRIYEKSSQFFPKDDNLNP